MSATPSSSSRRTLSRTLGVVATGALVWGLTSSIGAVPAHAWRYTDSTLTPGSVEVAPTVAQRVDLGESGLLWELTSEGTTVGRSPTTPLGAGFAHRVTVTATLEQLIPPSNGPGLGVHVARIIPLESKTLNVTVRRGETTAALPQISFNHRDSLVLPLNFNQKYRISYKFDWTTQSSKETFNGIFLGTVKATPNKQADGECSKEFPSSVRSPCKVDKRGWIMWPRT